MMKPRQFAPALFTIMLGLLAVVGYGNLDKTKSAITKLAANDTNTTKKSDSDFSPFVNEDGVISLPKDYKQKWSHLGSWVNAKKEGGKVHEMHNVYTQPETISVYNKTGLFPDGTVLVKEIRHAKTDRLTTGHASWSNDIKIWFVMIKDRKQRFEDNDHWGEGWGWALFEAKDPTKNVSAGYDTSCLSCHVPAEDTDWVYTFGYPDLKKKIKNKNTKR